jgi:SAM-dependent methyltransferase
VRDRVPSEPATVADLGCGSGATTARLVHRFPTARVTGIDTSESFVVAARARVARPTITTADVTGPVPTAPFDLVYSRFLLAHLPDVAAAIEHWLASVCPAGVLVLEETESIRTEDPVFARYEQLSVARVARAGSEMYAGPAIRAVLDADPLGADLLLDRVLDLDVTVGQAAALFWRNLATWGHDAVDQDRITEPDRAALLGARSEREGDDSPGPFVWGHHQTVRGRSPRPLPEVARRDRGGEVEGQGLDALGEEVGDPLVTFEHAPHAQGR